MWPNNDTGMLMQGSMRGAQLASCHSFRPLGEGIAYGIWLHREPDFESMRDYPPFKELMRPKG